MMFKHLTTLTFLTLLGSISQADERPHQFAGRCQAIDVKQAIAREFPIKIRFYVDQPIVDSPYANIAQVKSTKGSIIFTIRNPHTSRNGEILWPANIKTEAQVGTVILNSGAYNVAFSFVGYVSTIVGSSREFEAEVRASGESHGKMAGLKYTCRSF